MTKQGESLVVIGGGPAGYVGAIRASQLGMSVTLVEEDRLGGTCLNVGCIPTKALLRSAEVLDLVRHAEDFGVPLDQATVRPSLEAMVSRSQAIASKLSKGVAYLMKKHRVTVVSGRARLAGLGYIDVESPDGTKRRLESKRVLIATGARPRLLQHAMPDGKHIWTSRDALEAKRVPATLAVVGSGAIGMEFASFYCSLGSKVTVLEAQSRILPTEDEEIVAVARKQCEKRGIEFVVGVSVDEVKAVKGGAELAYRLNGKTHQLKAEAVLMAVGIVPNSDDMGLETTAVKRDARGFIETDATCMTGEAGIYAVGDVTAGPWLAHKAMHEAVRAVESMAGLATHPSRPEDVPGCIYMSPQIASIGWTEAHAKSQGATLKVGRFSFGANGKALALGEGEGLVKLLFDERTGTLLGAHMVGAEVTELIHSLVLARQLEATEIDIMRSIFPHPTLSEMIHEATLDAWGGSLHG